MLVASIPAATSGRGWAQWPVTRMPRRCTSVMNRALMSHRRKVRVLMWAEPNASARATARCTCPGSASGSTPARPPGRCASRYRTECRRSPPGAHELPGGDCTLEATKVDRSLVPNRGHASKYPASSRPVLVRVQVHEPGDEKASATVQHPRISRLDRTSGCDTRDPAALDQQVTGRRGRCAAAIDDVHVPDQHRRCHRRSVGDRPAEATLLSIG